MTIIVWDGATLATDCAAHSNGVKWQTTKAWYANGCILSGVGVLGNILLMREWYIAGAVPELFPKAQLLPGWCQFIVVDTAGLRRYEQVPVPIEHGFVPHAFGEGSAFALGALAMGANAAQAVAVANRFSVYCGCGVAEYSLGRGEHHE